MDLTGIKNKGGKPIGQEIYATLRSNHFVVDEKYVRATKNNEDSTLAEVNADFNSRISTLETNGGSLDPQGGVTKDYVDGLYNQTVTALNGKVNKAGEAQDITSDITFKDGFWITDGVDTASIALEEKLNIYTVGLGLSTDAGVYAKSFVKDGGTAQEVLLADGTTKALNEIGADTNQKVKAGDVTFGADDVVEFVAGNNVTIEGNAANKQITISSTGSNGIDYIEIAEGANNGEIKYRASSTGEYTNVTVHGLGDLAYKNTVGYDDLDNTAKGVLDSATGVSSTVDTLSDNLTSHIRNTDIHVTASDKTKWDGAVYGIKLSNGSENLPKSEGIVTLPFTATGDVITAGDNTVGTAAIVDGAVTESKLTDDLKTKVNYTYTLPTASSSQLGGVKVGSNLSISEGVLSATIPTKTSQLTNDSDFITSSTVASTYATKTDIDDKLDKITSSNASTVKSTLGLNNVGNYKAVSTAANQGLNTTEQSNARANIGAGTISTIKANNTSVPVSGDTADIGTVVRAITNGTSTINTVNSAGAMDISTLIPAYTAAEVAMTGYDNSDLTGNVAASDTILNAIGKVENQATAARAETSALDNRVTTLESSVTSNATAIAGKADKSATVSTIAYDTTNKKITKTINGISSDVVTAAKIVADGGGLTSNDLSTLVQANDKGAANGVAPLNASRKIDADYLPSYVDDVIEGYYYNSNFFEDSTHNTRIAPEKGKIYVDLSTNKTYRWSGSTFVEISTSNAGTVTSVAMTVPTGLSVKNSPITSSGTLAISLASGYSIPTTAKQANWDTAYSWGNHAAAGYVTDVRVGGVSQVSGGVADITIGNGTLTATFPSGIGDKTFNADQRSNEAWDLTGLALSSDIPTLASLMGSSAIGSSSEPIYWNGSAFAAATSTSGNVSEMTGATNTTAGTAGIVPRPLAGDQNRFLCGTGSWEDIKVDVGERVSSNSTSSSYGFITPWPGLRYYDTSVNGLCIGVDRITDGLGYRWESADGFTVRYGNGGTLYPVCKRRGSTVDMPRYKDLDPTLDQGYSFYNTDMHKQLYAEILVQNMQYAISGTTQQVTVYSYRWKDSGGYTWAVSNHVDYNGNLYRNGSKITLNRSNDPCMIRLDNLLGFYVGSTHYDWGSSTNIVIDASIEYGILTTHDIGRVFAANGTKAMMLTSIQEEDTTISTGEESLTLTCTFTACDGSDLSYTRECVVNNISYE